MYECPECEAIITGQSQGGAIATVFAITVEDIHPTIIAFGTPASIIGYCPPIDVNKYYRFLNTVVDEQGNLKYDPVPYFNMEADQRGHLFIMGDDRENVVFYGDGSGPSSLTFPIPLDLDAHQIRAYLRRMRNYHNRSDLGTDGWSDGYACNLQEECQNYCVDKRCTVYPRVGETASTSGALQRSGNTLVFLLITIWQWYAERLDRIS